MLYWLAFTLIQVGDDTPANRHTVAVSIIKILIRFMILGCILGIIFIYRGTADPIHGITWLFILMIPFISAMINVCVARYKMSDTYIIAKIELNQLANNKSKKEEIDDILFINKQKLNTVPFNNPVDIRPSSKDVRFKIGNFNTFKIDYLHDKIKNKDKPYKVEQLADNYLTRKKAYIKDRRS